MSSQLMMDFLKQVMYHDTSILMDDVASHCFMSCVFTKTVELKVKEINITYGHIKVHAKMQQYHRATSLLLQLIVVGDDVEDTMATPYATMLKEFTNAF